MRSGADAAGTPRSPGARRARASALGARLLPALRVLGFVAAVAIVAAMAVRAARGLEVDDVVWWPLALALPAAAAWWLLQGHGWALLVGGGSARRYLSVWTRTQALRYLPGGIWAPASRATIVSGSILDRVATAAADQVIALAAATALGSLALAARGDLRWLRLVVLFAVPVIGSRFTRPRTRIRPARTLRVSWNFLAAFALYALAAVLVQSAVSGLADPLAVAGAACLAWSAGFVVVVTPSGLGVREVVYAALLAGVFPAAELAAGALVLRVVTIVAELVVLLVVGRPASSR